LCTPEINDEAYNQMTETHGRNRNIEGAVREDREDMDDQHMHTAGPSTLACRQGQWGPHLEWMKCRSLVIPVIQRLERSTGVVERGRRRLMYHKHER